MKYLKDMPSSGDIKKLDHAEMTNLCEQCRNVVLGMVAKNGGHLGSNLGIVELTVALHYVFDFPKDKLIFDVGHQSYVHKLLSGRKLDNLRKMDGISGFQNRNESEYDCFGGGHSGTALPAALGFATASKLKQEDSYTVAVVGDGAFTNGMVHEALLNASDAKDMRLIIILNDNDMSIAKNIGGVSRCFGKLRTSAGYHRFKRNFKRSTSRMRFIGRPIAAIGKCAKNLVKSLIWKSNIFENYGLDYMGPVDGHNLKKLVRILQEAKMNTGITVVHVETVKGKGYEYAEKYPEIYHSVGAFDPKMGINNNAGNSSFDKEFGERLSWSANTNKDIVAITAAMCDGTGLSKFEKDHADRFFDVGIAEEHAVTFSAGLAAAGLRPVFAVYSSFLQRGYDQIIHDVAIQNLPVIFAISHAGFVPADGPTHQGIFDSGFLLTVPNLEVYSIDCYEDISGVLDRALISDNPVAIRYPKGEEELYSRECFGSDKATDMLNKGYKTCCFGNGDNSQKKKVCLITHGRLTKQIHDAAVALSDTYSVRIISITRIKPLNVEDILDYCTDSDYVYFLEEQIRIGGVGEVLFAQMSQFGRTLPTFEINAITDHFPKQGTVNELYEMYGFTAAQIEQHIREKV